MAVWSGAVLLLCFLLHILLLVLLMRRQFAADIRVFTGLLLFYVVRTAVLYGIMRGMQNHAYAELQDSFGTMDFLLQLALAGELFASMALSVRSRAAAGAIALMIAAGVTAGLAALLPARSPAPADRGVIFTGVLFAVLPAFAGRKRLRRWARAVATGLAVVGTAGVISQCAKSVAAFHRDGRAYVAWSYGNGGVYLAVLVFWVSYSARAYRVESTGKPWAIPVS